ncbi:MAG TPA: YihY/virulence factor BrkB family protein [Acidimicrobiia bacterium]|nr:YihY/virulence factor BrkB family protein [Acidimicrobiia bacterium]
MPDVKKYVSRIDQFQQRHRPFGFVFGVIKKFGDDQGGNLAALITYYGFLSLFPLLLVLVTVLGFVFHSHQDQIVKSALADFPIIGDQIKQQVKAPQGNGIGLALGVLAALWGGLGIANAAQDAMNRVWAVPIRTRPGFFPRVLRSFAIVGMLFVGIVGITVVSTIATNMSGLGSWLRVVTILASLTLNTALFSLAYRVLTAADVGWRDVWPGALVAALGWEVLQAVGGRLVQHQIKGMSQTYGFFAIVLGLLAWIFLLARVFLYAAEVNVVRKERLWPRALAPPPLTDADHRAYEKYAETEERRPGEDVRVTHSA